MKQIEHGNQSPTKGRGEGWSGTEGCVEKQNDAVEAYKGVYEADVPPTV